MSYPVSHILDLPNEQVIWKASDDEMYQCIAKTPGIKLSDPFWQIRKVWNSGNAFPFIRYAESSIEYKFAATDLATVQGYSYPNAI